MKGKKEHRTASAESKSTSTFFGKGLKSGTGIWEKQEEEIRLITHGGWGGAGGGKDIQ